MTRSGRRVGRENRIRIRHDRVELGEDFALDLLVFDDGLHDELAVREISQIGGETQTPCGLLTLTFCDLSAAHAAVERTQDA
jgi:hypothetical protein